VSIPDVDPSAQGAYQMNYGGISPNIVCFKITANSSYSNIRYYWNDSGAGITYDASKGIVYYPSSNVERIAIFLDGPESGGVVPEYKYVVVLQEEPAYPDPD